ncbi:hypothetical protein WDU94_014890 [Cyamophila willieti]
MYLYLNLPLLCLLHSKSMVQGQMLYHSYHTYDIYSQSEENDYSHSTTQGKFEYHDFMTEPKNMTEFGERVIEHAEGYHHLESVLENLDRGQYTLDEPYHIKHSSIGFNAHLDNPITAARIAVLLMDHFQYPNTSKTEYPVSKPQLKVLDIGSGTGYTSTIFGHLVGHEGSVIGLEHVPELVKLAHMALEYDHYHFLQSERVRFLQKDGRKGHAEEGPYDIIHVGAACLEVPEEILAQLKPGGRLVFHKGNHYGHAQILTYIDRYPNGTYSEEIQDSEIEKPLEGLVSLKTQMDEFKLRLQGKYVKRYRIDNPQEDFRHVLGNKRYGETMNLYSVSPYMPPNYTGYTHDFFDSFDASVHRKQGFERSDMIV